MPPVVAIGLSAWEKLTVAAAAPHVQPVSGVLTSARRSGQIHYLKEKWQLEYRVEQLHAAVPLLS